MEASLKIYIRHIDFVLTLPLPFAYISNAVFLYTHKELHIFLTWSRHTMNPSSYIYHLRVGLGNLGKQVVLLCRNTRLNARKEKNWLRVVLVFFIS